MASSALGSAYVLSNEGVRQLVDLESHGSAPISAPGFVSNRPADKESLERKLSALQGLVVGARRA
jgi:hypothetical protein